VATLRRDVVGGADAGDPVAPLGLGQLRERHEAEVGVRHVLLEVAKEPAAGGVEQRLAGVHEGGGVVVGERVDVRAEALGVTKLDEEVVDGLDDLRRVPAALVVDQQLADGVRPQHGVDDHRELVKRLPARVRAEGHRDVTLRGGGAAEGLELIERRGDGQPLFVEQVLVVVHADEVGLERQPVELAVDGRPLDRGRVDPILPAVLNGEVVQRGEQPGVGQDAGIARARIVEDHVRAGPGGHGRVNRVPHLIGLDGLAGDFDGRVGGGELLVDVVDDRRLGTRELVPDAELDRVLGGGAGRGEPEERDDGEEGDDERAGETTT